MNEAAKKKLLQMIPHALYVLTTQAQGKTAASTMSWVNQASFNPPMITVGVKKDTFTFEVLKQARAFVLNYLGEEQKDIAQKFFKHVEPVGNTLAGEAFGPSPILKFPMFPTMAGHVECKVIHIFEEGDHVVVVGEVLEAEMGPAKGPLLLSSTGWNYGG